LERSSAPLDNAMEYNIPVGGLAGDVTKAVLTNVLCSPNLDLSGDPPQLTVPLPSCCNAKVMVDSMELKAKRDGKTGTGRDGRDGSGFCHRNKGE